MVLWFARHLAIQDVYKTLAEFVFLLWIMTHCNPCLAKTGQGSLYLFVSTKSSKNEYTGTDEYYSEWFTASSYRVIRLYLKIWKHSYIKIKLPQKHTYGSMYFNVLYQLFPFHWNKKWLILITTMTSEYSIKDHWVKLSWFSSQYKSFFFRCVVPGAIPRNYM